MDELMVAEDVVDALEADSIEGRQKIHKISVRSNSANNKNTELSQLPENVYQSAQSLIEQDVPFEEPKDCKYADAQRMSTEEIATGILTQMVNHVTREDLHVTGYMGEQAKDVTRDQPMLRREKLKSSPAIKYVAPSISYGSISSAGMESSRSSEQSVKLKKVESIEGTAKQKSDWEHRWKLLGLDDDVHEPATQLTVDHMHTQVTKMNELMAGLNLETTSSKSATKSLQKSVQKLDELVDSGFEWQSPISSVIETSTSESMPDAAHNFLNVDDFESKTALPELDQSLFTNMLGKTEAVVTSDEIYLSDGEEEFEDSVQDLFELKSSFNAWESGRQVVYNDDDNDQNEEFFDAICG